MSDLRAVAISRLDPEGHGVHVAWSGPDMLPLAIGGYEVRRRVSERDKTSRTRVVFDAQQLDELERIGYLPDSLGTILCRGGEWPVRHFGIRPPQPVLSSSPAANRERASTATTSLLSTAPLAPFPTRR